MHSSKSLCTCLLIRRLLLKSTTTRLPSSSITLSRNFSLSSSYPCEPKESLIGYIGRNLGMLKKEMTSKIKNENLDHIFDQSRLLWKFEGQEVLKDFYVITDDTIGGHSWAKLEVSRNNHLLFHGRTSTILPRDGETARSGFCSFRSKPFERSFNRKLTMDLDPFNTLAIKLKGDGRAFMVNIFTDSYFSITEDDIWSYFLFTRGGPYWQTVNIPFSKFFLSNRGRVQDKQSPLEAERVRGVGLTLADSIDGEFSLEVEWIKAAYDPTHSEEFAYEQYYNPW